MFDSEDNCPSAVNPDQADLDGDGFGDVCDNDDDGDYTRDTNDNCPRYPNPDQLDADHDKTGAGVRRQRHAAASDCDAVDPDADATVSVTDRQPPRVTVSVRSLAPGRRGRATG